jgi:hypothetical protein
MMLNDLCIPSVRYKCSCFYKISYMDEIQQHDMFLLPRSLHCILQGCYIMAEWFQTGQYMLKFCLSLVHHTVYIVYCTFLTGTMCHTALVILFSIRFIEEKIFIEKLI